MPGVAGSRSKSNSRPIQDGFLVMKVKDYKTREGKPRKKMQGSIKFDDGTSISISFNIDGSGKIFTKDGTNKNAGKKISYANWAIFESNGGM